MSDWRTIPSLPQYSASSDGRIRRDVKVYNRVPGPLHPVIAPNGYALVNVRSVNRLVHRLVAEAFLGPDRRQVRHLDGDKTNNAITNLAYGTAKENAQDKREHGTYYHSHCRQGHELTEDNSAWSQSARGPIRRCRTCKRAYDQARRTRRSTP